MISEHTSRDHPAAHHPLRETIRCGVLVVDHAAREVRVGERPLTLTLREYELLRFLLMGQSRVYSREALVAILWAGQREVGLRTIDGHVRRLRAKLGPELRDCIRTVRGVGYGFSPPPGTACYGRSSAEPCR